MCERGAYGCGIYVMLMTVWAADSRNIIVLGPGLDWSVFDRSVMFIYTIWSFYSSLASLGGALHMQLQLLRLTEPN